MKSKIIAKTVFAAAILGLGAATELFGAGEEFSPKIQKVTVNGETLFDAEAGGAKTLTVTESPAKFEYIFVNAGNRPAINPAMVFVHLRRDEKNVKGADFKPATPVTKWAPGQAVTEKQEINLASQNGAEVILRAGFYGAGAPSPSGRYYLANNGSEVIEIGRLKISGTLKDDGEANKQAVLNVMFGTPKEGKK
jgi:hypothetical protein